MTDQEETKYRRLVRQTVRGWIGWIYEDCKKEAIFTYGPSWDSGRVHQAVNDELDRLKGRA